MRRNGSQVDRPHWVDHNGEFTTMASGTHRVMMDEAHVLPHELDDPLSGFVGHVLSLRYGPVLPQIQATASPALPPASSWSCSTIVLQ